MANKYTEAQARASRKYQAKTVAIQVRVTEEQRNKYKELAASHGKSLNQYIVDLLDQEVDHE